ncbi:VRR-NUC domain-containing protein [Salipiger sp. 1_MG-2023]|uniref:VRR-NUC domain-containing protein n=1 Tax=Salipiger sp. 1_MG-2023 TaxID=3062665 RepID=UPI0026E43D63|nr:VRR-NUC domain-containing protein [Salipiger sp. 1_MG-2023]MDO6588527.1 VRR-NUC domain-containing protein [Salipiger sp. 1_MG-2023]
MNNLNPLKRADVIFLESNQISVSSAPLLRRSRKEWRHTQNDEWESVEAAAIKYLSREKGLYVDERRLLAVLLEATFTKKSATKITLESMIRSGPTAFYALHRHTESQRSEIVQKISERSSEWDYIERVLFTIYGWSKAAKSKSAFKNFFPQFYQHQEPPKDFVNRLRNCWKNFHCELPRMAQTTIDNKRMKLRHTYTNEISELARFDPKELIIASHERRKTGDYSAFHKVHSSIAKFPVTLPLRFLNEDDSHSFLESLPKYRSSLSARELMELSHKPNFDPTSIPEASWQAKNSEIVRLMVEISELEEQGSWLSMDSLDASGTYGWADIFAYGANGERKIIEVKAPGDRLTHNQREFLPLAQRNGWQVRILCPHEADQGAS